MKKILIIEDDKNLQEGLAFSLKLEKYEILTASTIKQSMEFLQSEKIDLILLDCNLPDGSGFNLCTKIKQKEEIPILMLTARDTEMDEVKALELGMDDFMSKPFSLAVLKARIKKLIGKREPQMKLVSSGIEVDKRTCKVLKNGVSIECSKMEYQILVYLMENSGMVLSKEQILIVTDSFKDTLLYHNRKWTMEVLNNILENAVKYSKEQTQIKIEVYPLELFTEIRITDQGIGIKKAEQTEIFKRFYRSKEVEQKEGSGIGLYLCRLILEQENGYLTVASEYGKGSSFSVFLQNCQKLEESL